MKDLAFLPPPNLARDRDGRLLPTDSRTLEREVKGELKRLSVKAMWRMAEALDAEHHIVVKVGMDKEQIVKVPDNRLRLEAAKLVHERAWGRPKQMIDLSVEEMAKPTLDLSQLTDEELQALHILQRAQVRMKELGVAKVGELNEVPSGLLSRAPPLMKRP